MPGTLKVKALYEYASNHEDDLPFAVGQIITVTDDEDPDWYEGEYVDDSGVKQEGIFPRNFVEKYEPTAPPRPTRVRKKEPEHAPVADATPTTPVAPPRATVASPRQEKPEESHQEPAITSPPTPPAAAPNSPPASVFPVAHPPEPEPVSAPAPPPAAAPAIETPSAPSVPNVPSSAQPPKEPTQAKQPPPVAGKPSSFKDRIAAFNKPAAPPIAPFKPGGLSAGPSGFIKKPFVAPPPSRHAYVPPPQQAPTAKVYRRDEDPEIKERQAENQENAEKAGLAPAAITGGEGEDQPKPTSLKERIALLQKQQAEQAQRHAEAVAKKKPKRPPPKRTESEATQEQPSLADETEAHAPPSERKDPAEHTSKKSLDISRSSLDESSPPRQPLPIRRRSLKGPIENDGNEADMSGAGDTTEGQEDLTEKEDSDAQTNPTIHAPEPAVVKPAEENVEEEEEEEEEDPEVRRREELRARMAKMSGGMGFHGMFGPPGMATGPPPMPPKKKKPPTPERRSSEMAEPSSPRAAPPIPTMMALPGLGKQKSKEEETPETEQGETTEENVTPVAVPTSPRREVPEPLSPTLGGAPPIPGSRPAPPPVPTQSRPPPPPPPVAAAQSPGSETDDELSENPQRTPLAEAIPTTRAPPPPIPMSSPTLPSSPRPSVDKGARFSSEEPPLTSPPMSPQFNKRNSRPPPPPPVLSGAPPPTQGRPPPPPPPGASSRPSTSEERVVEPMKPGTLDNGEEAENTEYEGDYDTDIASSVPHKDALKSHARESSLEDNAPIPDAPPSIPPPLPAAAAPSAGPPPIPSQPAHRMSMDRPRVPPPPPKSPPSRAFSNDDYDPFNYNSAQAVSSTQSFGPSKPEEFQPGSEAAPSYQVSPPPHGPPSAPQPPREPPRAPPKKSLDIQRAMAGRLSGDASRSSISAEAGFMANEIDLAAHTNWWSLPNGLPPVYQGRKDIYTESIESTVSTAEGRTLVTKEVFILFQDYSQTVITIAFDPQDPSSTELDQRHEPPPRTLRQDQLEQAYETYGQKIATAIATRKDSVGDGTPHGLVHELLKPLQDALRPVGTRAYGALVYANLANASTQMNDEIRPGDIVSFRNAKFSGKHGPMHAKYSTEVGKPDHVGVVAEWDGTKKKVRAWEQGRESKKCKQESFKLDDLRSGEVKVWRVMPRAWVGWNRPASNISQD